MKKKKKMWINFQISQNLSQCCTFNASVKSALSIRSAKMFDPKSLSCSGMSLGVIGGRVGKTKVGGLGVAHSAGIYWGGIAWGICCWDGVVG